MPYPDESQERPTQERPDPDLWVPEMDRSGWDDRHDGLSHDVWIKRDGLTPDALTTLQLLAPNEKLKHLVALGGDIGSVQRDGFLYANFLEQLKQTAPLSENDTDETAANNAADDVVNRMKTMGLTSAHWDEKDGGPPKGASPRPWRSVADWLWGLLNKVGRFLVDSIEAFMALARDLLLDAQSHQPAIAFSASIPPAIEFEISIAYFTDRNKWSILKDFINAILKEMGKLR
jgi:hypothetical protein